MFEGIDWDKIEIGKQYKYEEGYYLQAEVTILNKFIEDDGKYISYEIRIDNAVHKGKNGLVLTVGKNIDKKYDYITYNMKFKNLNDPFDYITPGNPISNYLNNKNKD